MIPVQEFFSYFGVKGFYGASMIEVENMILYGEESLNKPLPATKAIAWSSEANERKDETDDFQELYNNSLLSKFQCKLCFFSLI